MKYDQVKTRMPKIDIPKTTNFSRVSIYSENYKGEYYNLPIEKLLPFKKQARKNFDKESLALLASTIKEYGIRQPLSVVASAEKAGFFEIVSGERRFLAAKMLGLTQVPCIIIHEVAKVEEIALIENIHRKDLHPLELANAYQSLIEGKICKTMHDIADKVGVTKSSVVETLGLLNLPEKTKKLLLTKQIKSRDLFRKLGKASENKHNLLIDNYLKNKSSVKTSKPSSKVSLKKILTINLINNEIVIEEGEINDLAYDHKYKIREYFRKFKYF